MKETPIEMNLLEQYKKDIVDRFSPREKLLVAVSGGLDSVVLAHLCQRAGLSFAIAHANFQLRGDESTQDEVFVRGLGEQLGVEVLVRKFDTAAYAADHACSIQVAARELRYAWFKEIHDGPVLTAHHRDDNIETLLMNFFKGTGIAGLRAMLPRQGQVVRPLLFATREDIHQYATKEGLEWREDSSNLSDKYTRNYFRHQLIPMLQTVYPGVMDNLGDNIGRFRDIEEIYRQAVGEQKRKLLQQKGDETHIPVLKLKKAPALHTIVYEIIQDYGFSAQQTPAVVALLDSGSGKYVLSATHRILKDRSWLIISPVQDVPADNVLIEGPGLVRFEGGALRLKFLDPLPPGYEKSPATEAFVDADEIKWPLLLRKWRQGDYFYPLGMTKKKKLARFFIDAKLSLAQKEKVWVLEMDKRIVWVVGVRIDHRVRVQEGTRRVLHCSIAPVRP